MERSSSKLWILLVAVNLTWCMFGNVLSALVDCSLGECSAPESGRQSSSKHRASDERIDLPEKPNVVIIYADDAAYGDLNQYGHPTTSTPHLGRMVNEGMRLMQFYSAAPVCTPSRASLMTGRLYARAGVYKGTPGDHNQTGMAIFNPFSNGGLSLKEITIAQMMKEQGYATGMVGKWHLGIKPEYLPASRGFDSYFGIPMTHSMCTSDVENTTDYGPCPILHNTTVAVQPADVQNIDSQYVNNIKEFMTLHQANPFFFYFASHHPHIPQFASKNFLNTTRRGLYGDALAELDWSVGQILDHVVELGIQNRTLVVFTSDNGPALVQEEMGGEQGPLKCGKGTSYEGGVREPAIFWWPGVVAPGAISYALGSTLDLSVTAVSLAGGKPPQDRAIDGFDLTPVLSGESETGPRDFMLYYMGYTLMAVRQKQYKAHFWTKGGLCNITYHDQDCWNSTPLTKHDPPLLFDLETDTKERFALNVTQYADVLESIMTLKAEHEKSMTFEPSEVDKGVDPANFPCCNPSCTPRNACCACPQF